MATFLLEGRAVLGRCQNVIKCDNFNILFLLARLHEVHRAIVVTSVVSVYVYMYVYVRVTLSVKVFKIVIS